MDFAPEFPRGGFIPVPHPFNSRGQRHCSLFHRQGRAAATIITAPNTY